MADFAQRMLGAAKLEVSAYEDVERDPKAIGQAIAVVILSSIAAGIGSYGVAGLAGMAGGALISLVGWFIMASLSYIVGTKILPEPQTRADVGELLRTTGFAATPGLLSVFGFIPFFGWLFRVIASIWMLIAFVIAVRTALDYRSTARAVMVCFVGWIFYVALSVTYALFSTIV
jgi:hypothetical protein